MSASPIDPDRFAALLCDYCLEVQDGQQVLVRAPTPAAPLLLALQRAILERGAWPLLRPELPGQVAGYHEHARTPQLDAPGSAALAEAREIDALLSIQAPAAVDELQRVDPERLARAARGRSALRELQLRRRWCGTLWPTPAAASHAGLGEEEFERFVARALMLDRADAAAGWRELGARQADLIARLRDAREIRIEAPGTDISLNVAGRDWVNSDGRRNMPSGEVFTGPHEDSARGRIRFTVPSAPAGLRVEGVELELDRGVVVAARADVGEEYLLRALETDDGARRIGELGIGTNAGIDRAIGVILFDEKIAGTVHLALGRSYPETGGVNESALHWDLICDLRDEGRLSADGTTIMEAGRFA